ncbi:MAG: Ig-like domain-containing protein, partial [Gammaproteobacteria bacterium]|nr:Ig-like domain-containing protein [Gammaproteobacteria bacterium]
MVKQILNVFVQHARLLCSMLILSTASGVTSAAPITLNPVADSFVNSINTGTNYGSNIYLVTHIGNGGWFPTPTNLSYIKFDLSSTTPVIDARLYLYSTLSAAGYATATLADVSDTSWSESTITWANKPAIGSGLAVFSVTSTNVATFSFDITGYVNSKRAGGNTAVSLGLYPSSQSASTIYINSGSRESAYSPKLVVTFDEPPTVSLASPVTGAVYAASTAISLSANASDNTGTVSKVEFYNGTTLLGTATTAPFAYTWTNVPAGSYTLTAKAYDNYNLSATSTAVTITVEQAPTVALTSPANGALYVAPATLSLTASAADSDGSVSKVEFYNGATLLGQLTTAPYAYTWNNVAAGNYTLSAKAYDNLGISTLSSSVAITVDQPPAVSLTSPANGAVVVAPATLTLTANAADSDGTVSKVEFYNGVTLLGTATTAPYTYAWSNVAAGNYTLTAKAYDNLGASTTSSPVAINVDQTPMVSLTAPVSGAVLAAPAAIVFNATATDSDGTVTKVEFYSGTTLLGLSTAPPYTFTWSNVPGGSYSLTAMAYDNLGISATSLPVAITVEQAPSVSLTSPVNGAVVVAPATMTLTADAADSDGTINKVEFYNGATLVGTATTAPYTYAWSNVAAGNYTLKAKAYDDLGVSTMSSSVSLIVNQPPTVTLVSPTEGASYYDPATIMLTANAADSDGMIARVEFYWGGNYIGQV